MNEKLKEKYQRFLEWQQQPHQVKPLSEEEHDCNTCHTHYKGNYCPRCGQASSISRYSNLARRRSRMPKARDWPYAALRLAGGR